LYLTTTGWRSGKLHRIEIWFITYEGKYYISERHEQAHWVKNIIHDPKISFAVDNNTFEGTARLVDQDKDLELAVEVTKLMNAKYEKETNRIVEQVPYKRYEFSDFSIPYKFSNNTKYEVTLETRVMGDPKYQAEPIIANFD
jgi:hypothetical protein